MRLFFVFFLLSAIGCNRKNSMNEIETIKTIYQKNSHKTIVVEEKYEKGEARKISMDCNCPLDSAIGEGQCTTLYYSFFRNGNYDNPLVWYGKSPNKREYEFFNHPGLHPETGKTLKPISKYIIKKYTLSK